jgi:hypothetical protein
MYLEDKFEGWAIGDAGPCRIQIREGRLQICFPRIDRHRGCGIMHAGKSPNVAVTMVYSTLEQLQRLEILSMIYSRRHDIQRTVFENVFSVGSRSAARNARDC